jgi:hypothetical protein
MYCLSVTGTEGGERLKMNQDQGGHTLDILRSKVRDPKLFGCHCLWSSLHLRGQNQYAQP